MFLQILLIAEVLLARGTSSSAVLGTLHHFYNINCCWHWLPLKERNGAVFQKLTLGAMPAGSQMGNHIFDCFSAETTLIKLANQSLPIRSIFLHFYSSF